MSLQSDEVEAARNRVKPRAFALVYMTMETERDRVASEGVDAVEIDPWVATLWAIWRMEGDEATTLVARAIKSQRARQDKAFVDLGLLWTTASRIVTMRAAQLVETTRRVLSDTLDVADQYDDWLDSRASFIAENEILAAYGWSSHEMASVMGAREKEWNTVGDDRVRETHADANGQIRLMGEPFNVGGVALMYPGEPGGDSAETVNCRCWALPIL